MLFGFKITISVEHNLHKGTCFEGGVAFFFFNRLTANHTAFFSKILFKVRMHGDQRDTDHHVACAFTSGRGSKVN